MARKTGSERRDTNKRDPIAELETKIARIKKQLQTSGARGKGSQVTLLRTLENRLTQYKQNKAQFGNVWGNRRNENPMGRSVDKNKDNLKIDQNELKPDQYRIKEWTTDQEVDEQGKVVEEGFLKPIPTVDDKIVEEDKDPFSLESMQAQGLVGDNPLVAMQGDQLVYIGREDAKLEQFYQTKKLLNKQERQEINELNTATNNNYVTDYQTAIKQGVDQYYGEDMLGSDKGRIKKSNVFDTFEKSGWWGNEGETIGVIGRNARRAYDTAMHEAQIPTKDPVNIDPPETTTTKDIDTAPEPIEIKNTGEGGEVFKPAPVSSLFDPYKNMV